MEQEPEEETGKKAQRDPSKNSNKTKDEQNKSESPKPQSPYAPEKTDFFDVNFDRLAQGTRRKKETVPGKTNGTDAIVVGLIAVAFIFTQAMSWMAVVAGLGGGILAVLSWRKEYRALRLYISFVFNAGGIIGGLIAYFIYLFG